MAENRLIDVSKWDGYYTARKQSLEVYDPYYDGYEDALDHVDDWMNARPTVDAVEVVRCKDCKHRGEYRCPMFHTEDVYSELDGWDQIVDDYTTDEGFCHKGEREGNG